MSVIFSLLFSFMITKYVQCQLNNTLNDIISEAAEDILFDVEHQCRFLNYPDEPERGFVLPAGVRTLENEFTHMAALGWLLPNGSYDFFCGGTLIAPTFVLTAAHCRTRNGQRPSIVRIGGAPLTSNQAEHQPIQISNLYPHPEYRRRSVYNDIAIIQLASRAMQMPSCLWRRNTITYRKATAIGYGETGQDLPKSIFLIKATLNLFSNKICSSYYTPFNSVRVKDGVRETQLCAGDVNGIQDTCPGDSGGPILYRAKVGEDVIPYILGITSSGPTCTTGTPGLYTRVSSFTEWIVSSIRQYGGAEFIEDNRCGMLNNFS